MRRDGQVDTKSSKTVRKISTCLAQSIIENMSIRVRPDLLGTNTHTAETW